MEGLPVYIVVGTPVVAVPLVVVCPFVVDWAVPPTVLVGVGYAAARLVVALRMGVGAVFVGVVPRTAPEAVL